MKKEITGTVTGVQRNDGKMAVVQVEHGDGEGSVVHLYRHLIGDKVTLPGPGEDWAGFRATFTGVTRQIKDQEILVASGVKK